MLELKLNHVSKTGAGLDVLIGREMLENLFTDCQLVQFYDVTLSHIP